MLSTFTVVEGPVSLDGEHMLLSYGSVDDRLKSAQRPFPIAARIAAPKDNVITLEILVTESTADTKEVVAEVRRQVHRMFTETGERNPWAYAKHHCTTAANIYSKIHWSWIAAANNDRI